MPSPPAGTGTRLKQQLQYSNKYNNSRNSSAADVAAQYGLEVAGAVGGLELACSLSDGWQFQVLAVILKLIEILDRDVMQA